MQNIRKHSPIVQSVERRTVNPYVVGSSPTRGATWPVGQAVKTPPFHGGIRGSIPLGTTNQRGRFLLNVLFLQHLFNVCRFKINVF